MDKTGLEFRMRRYETVSRNYLMRRQPVIIRIDGKAFHTFTNGLICPYDELFHRVMNDTMRYLCENMQGCVLGYTQSDEISLLLSDYQKLDTDAWFGYNVQKIVSVSASMATMSFNKFFRREAIEYSISSDELDGLSDDEIDKQYAYRDVLHDIANEGAIFDSRAFNLPKEEVNNYFLWRQQNCERNFMQALVQISYSHEQTDSLSNNDLQNKMFTEKGVNWNNCPVKQKRGVCCVYGMHSHKWYTDDNIPIFSVQPDYINSRIAFDDSEVDKNG